MCCGIATLRRRHSSNRLAARKAPGARPSTKPRCGLPFNRLRPPLRLRRLRCKPRSSRVWLIDAPRGADGKQLFWKINEAPARSQNEKQPGPMRSSASLAQRAEVQHGRSGIGAILERAVEHGRDRSLMAGGRVKGTGRTHNRSFWPFWCVTGSAATIDTRRAETQSGSAAPQAQESVTRPAGGGRPNPPKTRA